MILVSTRHSVSMILLYTDFGTTGPYVGQMKAVLTRMAPDVPVVDIMHDAPVWNPRAAAYYLAALAQQSEAGDVWLCVVDPGVGGERLPIILDCGGVSFVGPDNGLFELIYRWISGARRKTIEWRPDSLSATFHGRDLFAPVAAWLSCGEDVPGNYLDPSAERPGKDWPDDLAEIIYIDAYGNLITGIGGAAVSDDHSIRIGSQYLRHASTFSDVSEGELFWHRNSSGLIEIAASQARADECLMLRPGDSVEII
jgi:S-adenosylmethionine hydrolase